VQGLERVSGTTLLRQAGEHSDLLLGVLGEVMKQKRKLLLLAAAMAAMVMTSSALPSSAAAAVTCPGKNGKIAAAGSNGLAVVGERGVRWFLLERDSYLWQPSFSCGGTAVAFVSDNETTCPPIEVLSVVSGKRRLFSGKKRTSAFPTGGCAGSPSFLSGGRLLFSVRSRGGTGTYVASADGTRRHRLFGSGACANTADARWFVSGCASRSLILRDATGHRVRTLTPLPTHRKVRYPAASLSADGRRIVYSRQVEVPARSGFAPSDIYVVRRDGTHRRRLTTGGDSFDPTLSPDGRWVAFTRGSQAFGQELVAMPLAHPGRVKVLAKFEDGVRSPSWGPRRR
jgi:hypothetical protein